MSEAILSVKSELGKVIEQLTKLQEQGDKVGESLRRAGNDTGESLNKQVKQTETFFGKLANAGRRVADQLRGDFKSLASINALSGALKLSSQFSGSIKETLSLNDAIRKLGPSFGVAQKDFAKLQATLTKGMGEIGMSSEEAGETLKGLAGMGITGEGNLSAYATRAAQLASLGGEKGKGGSIAGNLAAVVRERGGNVNDPRQMEEVARAVSKAMEGTGKGASELLEQMHDTFQSMTAEQRKKTTAGGLTNLAVAETVAGPEAAAAIKKYLGMNRQEKMGLEAQGFKKIFTKEGGIDVKGLKEFANDMKKRGLDLRGAAQTFGFSPEEAEGLVRLTQSADQLGAALDRTSKASDDVTSKTRAHMGLQEAFQANVNRVKAIVAGPLASATQGLSDTLGKTSAHAGTAGAVVAGGGVLAALLAGGALKGLGSGLGIGGMAKSMTLGAAKREAYEEITGRKVQDVYVTNADEIGGGGVARAAGGMMGMASKGLGISAAALGGYEVGGALNDLLDKTTQGTTSEGFSGSAVERLMFKLDKLLGGEASKRIMGAQKVVVEMNDQRLKATKQPTRGASVGPSR